MSFARCHKSMSHTVESRSDAITFETEIKLIHDLRRFFLTFGGLVANHAWQIYESALVVVPHGTALYKLCTCGNQQSCTMLNPVGRPSFQL